MKPLFVVFLGAVLVMGIGFVVATAQPGMPPDIVAYRTWTKMNASPMIDPSNPRAGPKNTFITLSPAELAEIIAPGGRVRRPFPDGTIAVRESLHPTERFVTVLFIMRKNSRAVETKGWEFSGVFRSAADQPFQPVPLTPNPQLRCLACHQQMKATDFVFQPFTSRPDPLPPRLPAAADRVEIFNNQFGPQTLRVRAGTSVTWVNYDLVPHDVKAADASFESGNLPTYGLYFLTFERPGTYEYFCGVHLEMRARVIVER